MASATRVMVSEYSVDLVAAFWLTMAATPEGAQGQVTFQVAFFLPPQEASSATHMAPTRARLRILFFIILLLFRFVIRYGLCRFIPHLWYPQFTTAPRFVQHLLTENQKSCMLIVLVVKTCL